MDVTQILYDWWTEYFELREQEAEETRKLLGYFDTALSPQRMTKAQFIVRLRRPGRDPAIKQRWLNRIVAAHESEVDSLPESARRFLRDCNANPPTFLDATNKLRDAS